MGTYRPFCYNPSPNPLIPGTEQVGSIAAAINISAITPSLEWWNGPDEDPGYIIAYVDPSGDRPNGPERVLGNNYICHIGFLRTDTKTDTDFVKLARRVLGNNTIVTGQQAKSALNSNGYWTSWPGVVPSGMSLFLDAGDQNSYSGTGNTWFDISGYDNHGTLSGATFSSVSGGTMVFDGVNDAITFSNPVEIPIGNDPYTISVWFNSDEMPSDRGFVGWGGFGNVNEVNAWRLRNNGGNSGFRHYWWGNDLDYDVQMSTGTWYHAVAAYENGSRKLYLNNVQVAEDFPTGHNVPYSTNLRVGVTADFLGEWFDGKIAQVIIYKRQATTNEIEAIWNSGKDRFGYGPTPILSLDAGDTNSYPGSGTIWTDTVGGLTFSLINGPVYDSSAGGNIFFTAGGGIGQSDYAECLTSLPTLPTYTISVWHKFENSLGSLPAIITEIQSGTGSINYKLGKITPSGFVQAGYYSNGSWRNTTIINSIDIVDKWSHILMSVDSGQNLKIYVNNVLIQSATFSGEIPTSSGQGIRLMKNHGVDEETWGGYLAKVDIYNRALNTTEISDIWNLNRDRFGI